MCLRFINIILCTFTFLYFLDDPNKQQYVMNVCILFKHTNWHQLIKVYTPICLVVIASWLPFWMDQSFILLRLMTGVTTTLAMAKLMYSCKPNLRAGFPSEYLNTWSKICFGFVVCAIVENASANLLSWLNIRNDNVENNCTSERKLSLSVGHHKNKNIPIDTVIIALVTLNKLKSVVYLRGGEYWRIPPPPPRSFFFRSCLIIIMKDNFNLS